MARDDDIELCLTCPLPDCRPRDRGCPLRRPPKSRTEGRKRRPHEKPQEPRLCPGCGNDTW